MLPRERMRRWIQGLRPMPFVALLAWAVHPAGPRAPGAASARDASLVGDLAALGYESRREDVRWLDAPPRLDSPWSLARAVVRASRPGGLADVYLVWARLSPEGALVHTASVYDLTKTSAVAEDHLAARGLHAAWTIGSADRTYRVELADLAGEPVPAGSDWTKVLHAERAITNLQRTGQLAGVGRRSFRLDPPAQGVRLVARDDRLVVEADQHRIEIPYDRRSAITGQRFVREDDREVSRPGNLVTWAVDRARDLSWFGDERMQLTKAIAYRALDAVDRAVGTVRRPSAESSATDIAQGALPAVATDPETGWPPAPVPPILPPGLPDEGRWLALDRDPFIRTNPGAPAPLVTTYLRGDATRAESRIYVVAWDPRQVELDMVPGTEEPQSATGETGTGMIPRKPEVISRVVAAFNGAFQSTHGDFGMMSNGAVLVPPKPYAATVARLSDGAVGFGTWPYDLTLPKDFVSFRQNLTPLVADGKFNPYGREWWGGVPHDWEDETRTVRSGVCLTREGFVAYFYGTKIDHVRLARAMIAARCDYGLHLDMNQGHTGLEFYRVFREGEPGLLPLPPRMDSQWQTEGDLLGMPGWKFRGRRLVRNLQLMHFPRYIRRGARDYFFLVLRPVLPGAALTMPGAEADEGSWDVHTLPRQGFPCSLATTSVRPDPSRPETKVRVLKLDPSTIEATSNANAQGLVLATEPGEAAPDATSLFIAHGRASVSSAPPPDAVRLFSGAASPGPRTAAGACVDHEGMVLYAEVVTAADPARDGPLVDRVLDAARCDAKIHFTKSPSLAIGGVRDLSEHPTQLGDSAVRLARATAPRSMRIFRETPILPPSDWMPLQRQTRWFPKDPEPMTSASPEPASTGPAAAATPER